MDLDVAGHRLDHHGRNDFEPVRFWFSGQRGWQSDGIPLFPKPFLFLARRPNVDPASEVTRAHAAVTAGGRHRGIGTVLASNVSFRRAGQGHG
jgi:hypothetical protein